MRIAAIGDLHCQRDSRGKIKELLRGIDEEADVLLLAGDLTNVGMMEEMEVLLGELDSLRLPIVAVPGNHDHESDHIEVLLNMMRSRGIHVLDGTSFQVGEVGFVGTKGFCGGFGNLRIQPFGERAIKGFIQATIDEVVRLENAAMGLSCARKVGVLHYSPISATLQGEEPELFPFLGSSLFADALDRQGTNAIVHGHAHKGSPEGRTSNNTPVYNVSQFVQARFGRRPCFCFDL
ncbi:MAG: metallophosphoesterase [Desulfobacteraceae bacterium]|nr:MAG: metallophosphoesterase [Desulfobacteraceae bacterium]